MTNKAMLTPCHAVDDWNALPDSIRNISDFLVFIIHYNDKVAGRPKRN